MDTTKNKLLTRTVFINKEYCRKIQKAFALIALLILCILITTTSSAQNAEDTTDHRFHDDLLDHLVGEWNDTAVAHGHTFTSHVDVKWVLNHQYLLIHLKSFEIIPWWNVEMEYYEYIGYNHYQKKYTVHGMSIEGDEDLSEGLAMVTELVMNLGQSQNLAPTHLLCNGLPGSQYPVRGILSRDGRLLEKRERYFLTRN